MSVLLQHFWGAFLKGGGDLKGTSVLQVLYVSKAHVNKKPVLPLKEEAEFPFLL